METEVNPSDLPETVFSICQDRRFRVWRGEWPCFLYDLSGSAVLGLMSADEFSNLVAISQVTPGPMAVNAATYVGFNCAGYAGAFAATLGVAMPSFLPCYLGMLLYQQI